MNRPPEDATVVRTFEGKTYHVWNDDGAVRVLVGCHDAILTETEATAVAEALILSAERNARHVVKIDRGTWVLKHPLSCRIAGLFNCEYNTAASISGFVDANGGEYECELDDDGTLRLL